MPFSYSAPRFSQEDQELEIAEMSPEEKEDMLDDVFGRNAEKIAAQNEREITKEELDAFDRALEDLPSDERVEALAATAMCPDLVEAETNPTMFLIRENFDPQKAAKRFAEYWDFRVDLLGDDKAFLPITLSEGGAFHEDEELLEMMRESPTYRVVLPEDSQGRGVLFMESDQESNAIDFSRNARIKYHFYMIHRLMERKSVVSRGMILFSSVNVTEGNFKLSKFDRIKMKKLFHFNIRCNPINVRSYHLVSGKSSMIETLLVPVVMYFSNPIPAIRQRFVYHYHTSTNGQKISPDSLFESLKPYGFKKEGIPRNLGGTYDLY